jgi:hypothetical protein
MIIENIKIRKNQKIRVTRVCDECGKKEKTNLGSICQGRKTRQADIDLCASCASSRKYKKYRRGQEHHSWKHGIAKGYKRITLEDGRRVEEQRYVYEQHIGRKLNKKETIHHIDLNKLNNKINNLILFNNHSEHKKCHNNSLESCALTFLNSKVWFNFKTNKYSLEYDKIFCRRNRIEIDLSIFGKVFETKYPMYKILQTDGSFKKRRCHTVTGEYLLGRKLYYGEVVHHIDGNYLNNDPNNLIVLNRHCHSLSHYSLQICTAKLLKMGFVGFDKKIKKYFIEKRKHIEYNN